MTAKDRILAALHGKEVDRIPFSPFLAYVWEHFPQDIRDRGQLAFHQRIGADPLWRGAPCPVKACPPAEMVCRTTEVNGRTEVSIHTPAGDLRQAWVRSESGNTSFLVEHPLKSEADYRIQLWIEENTAMAEDPSSVSAHFAGDGREGLSLGMLIPRGKSAFQSLVEHLAGTEELTYALADFPATVVALWHAMVAKDLEAVRLAMRSPYTHFTTWEDSSTQNYSPAQYDAYIGSEIGEWCRVLSAGGKNYVQHACGHVASLVGRMKAHGVLAVESLSPPPTGNITVRDARRAIGPSVGIIGGIEPTQFLRLSEGDLARYVETVFEEAAGGPFVLANSDSCPPGVTLAKFELVASIARARRA
ncbi:MAG: uroporphyrinogen decarboxylase family protein [bacterium]